MKIQQTILRNEFFVILQTRQPIKNNFLVEIKNEAARQFFAVRLVYREQTRVVVKKLMFSDLPKQALYFLKFLSGQKSPKNFYKLWKIFLMFFSYFDFLKIMFSGLGFFRIFSRKTVWPKPRISSWSSCSETNISNWISYLRFRNYFSDFERSFKTPYCWSLFLVRRIDKNVVSCVNNFYFEN